MVIVEAIALIPATPISRAPRWAGWLAAGVIGAGGVVNGPVATDAAAGASEWAAAQAQALEHSAPTGQRSLAPLDAEAFWLRYDQQRLFRLRLGADAGFEAPSRGSGCAGFQADWSGSTEHGEFERAMNADQPFAAGQALGRWQRLSSQCR